MKTFRRDQRLVIGPPPRVALLPPELVAARTWRTTRRTLAAAGAVVILVTGVLVGNAYLASMRSADRLAEAQAQTQRLLVKAQGYTEVTGLESHISKAEAAQRGLTGSWIDWRSVVSRVEKALPEGTCLTTFTASVAGATTAAGGSTATGDTSATAPTGTVATVTLGGATEDLGDVQAWITSLAKVPGFLDADPGSVSSEEGGSLKVGVSLYLGAKAYSSRAEATAVVPAQTASKVDTASLPAACSGTSGSTSTGSTSGSGTTTDGSTSGSTTGSTTTDGSTSTPTSTPEPTAVVVVPAQPAPTVTVTVPASSGSKADTRAKLQVKSAGPAMPVPAPTREAKR